MMKFFALVLAFSATQVFAAVKVGTSIDYNVSVTTAQKTEKGTLNYLVTDYDQAGDKYKVKSTYDNGTPNPQVVEDWAEAKNINFGADVVAKCAQYKGTEEEITVEAGKYKTCKVLQADLANDYAGTFWVADVPFGIVKSSETQAGETLTMELKSVK